MQGLVGWTLCFAYPRTLSIGPERCTCFVLRMVVCKLAEIDICASAIWLICKRWLSEDVVKVATRVVSRRGQCTGVRVERGKFG